MQRVTDSTPQCGWQIFPLYTPSAPNTTPATQTQSITLWRWTGDCWQAYSQDGVFWPSLKTPYLEGRERFSPSWYLLSNNSHLGSILWSCYCCCCCAKQAKGWRSAENWAQLGSPTSTNLQQPHTQGIRDARHQPLTMVCSVNTRILQQRQEDRTSAYSRPKIPTLSASSRPKIPTLYFYWIKV